MNALLLTALRAGGKALISMIMSLATEAFFTEVLIMIAELASKSTKTEIDDKFVKIMKENLEK